MFLTITTVLILLVAVDDATIDATLKHGRSTALFVGLKENASYIYTGIYVEKINRTLISHLQSPKVTSERNNHFSSKMNNTRSH